MALARPLPDPLVELVARQLRVLGQPVRVRLIERLDEVGETNVQTLADEMLVTQQNASKHLGALWSAGIVARRREGRITMYSLVNAESWAVIERVATSVAAQLRDREPDGP